jgi:hypothetical protein
MKNRKKKKKVITLALLLVIIITAVITEITSGVISLVYTSVKELLYPPKLELTLNTCFIYRTDLANFPVCELDIVAYNPSDQKITVELEKLTLFREDIDYYFSRGQAIIGVEPKSPIKEHIDVKDKVFESALKIPQDSISAVIALSYKNLKTHSTETLTLSDKDVIKCTYWQRPIFNSEKEAFDIGAAVLDISSEVFFTDPSTGKQGIRHPKIKAITNQTGLLDFNEKEFAKWIFQKKKMSWLSYIPAFRRKYGGIYLGFLASDTGCSKPTLFPYSIFSNIGDYEEYNLLGTTLDQDFSNVIEFIHYTFDPAKRNESFRLMYENCRYFVLLVYEEPQGVDSLSSHLKNKGYRVGSVSTNRFGVFEDILSKITPIEKGDGLEEKLNLYIDSLNYAIRNNGFFAFYPIPLDSATITRINNDIVDMTGKSHSVAVSFDCHPLQSPLVEALFSTPVLVFLNFTKQTMGVTLDSIKVRYR